MASTNSNKGRAAVLSAACVTMFFISSIALYSVVSKNLLAVYPEWSSALTWAFPVFQTIMAVTGIFAGRISDKIGPRNVVLAAAVCYGLGWFMSGAVTEPWQFYLWFSLVAAIGNGLGYGMNLVIVAFFRELFGSGTLLGYQIVPESWYIANGGGYSNNGLMLFPPMALIIVGCIIWVHRSHNKDLQEK